MKQSTMSVGFILLSLSLLYAKAASQCSCACGGEVVTKPENVLLHKPLVKQCAFKDLDDGRDMGQLMTCDFEKSFANSALRITYQGDMRLVSCKSSCCKRWFITINGKECAAPAPLDASIYSNGVTGLNLHRPGTIDGFCSNIPKGRVTVALSVGKCFSPLYAAGNARTCWDSTCRLIIEEVPSMQ